VVSYDSVSRRVMDIFHLSSESKSLLTADAIGATGILPFLFAKHFLDRQGIQPFGKRTIAGIAGLNEYGTIVSFATAAVLYIASVYDIEKNHGVSTIGMGASIAATVALVAGLFNLAFDPPVNMTALGSSITQGFKSASGTIAGAFTGTPPVVTNNGLVDQRGLTGLAI